ncbi:MAG: hypothetical protein ACRDE2_10280, partial [Chitinophagaceae bacterium]
RNASLNISLSGYGNKIKSFLLDGRQLKNVVIPGNLSGKHTIKIVLADNIISGKIHLAGDYFAPETPHAFLSGDTLKWQLVNTAKDYEIVINGKKATAIQDTQYKVTINQYSEYQVIAVDSAGYESFASSPVINIPSAILQTYQMVNFAPASSLPYKGFSGKGFVEISTTKNLKINFNITIPQEGEYAIDFRYANGNGPVNTDNKCAMRSLFINNQRISTVVFPQRGQGQWSDWGFSNALIVKLAKGTYPASLILEPVNTNMNETVNQAMLDYVRLIRLK